MTTSEGDRFAQAVEQLWKSNASIVRSISLIRWLGYGLLVLAFLDWGAMLIPFRVTDSIWQFQTFGEMVERVPVSLIGLVLVFAGERMERAKWEILCLKFLSWLALLASILFFLSIPLAIGNTSRINGINARQLSAQENTLKTQIQQAQEQLQGATTTADIEQLIGRLAGGGQTANIEENQLAEVRQQLSTSLNQSADTIATQVQQTRAAQQRALLKSSVKWNLGALISGILFFGIWRSTLWARRTYGRSEGSVKS